jgi:hypothetical protein
MLTAPSIREAFDIISFLKSYSGEAAKASCKRKLVNCLYTFQHIDASTLVT